MWMCVCVLCVRMCVCVRACVRVCVHMCVLLYVFVFVFGRLCVCVCTQPGDVRPKPLLARPISNFPNTCVSGTMISSTLLCIEFEKFNIMAKDLVHP
jgi:hypothetical protein